MKILSTVVSSLIVISTNLAFAQDTMIISPACKQKITGFADVFAKISMPYMGPDAVVVINNVKVNPKATLVGESGFANGKGTFDVNVTQDGETDTQTTEFDFLFITEPHCSVMKIQVSNLR